MTYFDHAPLTNLNSDEPFALCEKVAPSLCQCSAVALSSVVVAALSLSIFVISCMAANHHFSTQPISSLVNKVFIIFSVSSVLSLLVIKASSKYLSTNTVIASLLQIFIMSVVIFTCGSLALKGTLNARQFGFAVLGSYLGTFVFTKIIDRIPSGSINSNPTLP